MKTILIAPNSFKESLDAIAAAGAIEGGVLSACPGANIIVKPIADGGNDTVRIVCDALHGSIRTFTVRDPLNRPVSAGIGIIEEGDSAVIEMAQASGLHLVRPADRAPLSSSTAGLGELIRNARDLGCRRIVIGLGGSATVDCGLGMAHELGYRFRDRDGKILPPVPTSFKKIARIDPSGLESDISRVEFLCACDVTNPLLGDEGGLRIYGPQKGLRQEEIPTIEDGVANLVDVIERDLHVSHEESPGAGAAGGLGAGCRAFLGARLVPGAELIMDIIHMEEAVRRADLVLTGEGKLDEQSAFGKGIAVLSRMAAAEGKPVVALVGAVTGDIGPLYELGLTACFPINQHGDDPGEMLRWTARNLAEVAENIMLLYRHVNRVE